MSRTWRIVAFTAAIPFGVVLSMLVPVYDQPFGGCPSGSLFVANPHCGYWPEALRGALLVFPLALLVRSSVQLGALSLLVLLLALLGGTEGMSYGTHFQSFTPHRAISHFVWQLPGTVASILALSVGFGINRWRTTHAAA